jgi:glycosyltransferase involved in cell wall biosynthesis
MNIRITLAVLAYNQAHLVEHAVRSALEQACEPIQIVISDDCSTDGTSACIESLASRYRGPHRVLVRRNAVNLGIAGHFNAIMEAAEGRLVVIMAGDDVSRRDRVAITAEAWDRSGEALNLLGAHVIDMDEHGTTLGIRRVDPLQEWRSVHDWSDRRPYVLGAAHAVTRRLHDRFGPLAAGAGQEDQVNTLRAVLSGSASTIDDALVRYRRGGVSTVTPSAATYRLWEARRSATHLALYAQWIQDAALAGHETVVGAAIEGLRQRDAFLHELMTAASLGEQIRVVRGHPGVGTQWRWKRLLQLRMYRAHHAAKWLRGQLHGPAQPGSA